MKDQILKNYEAAFDSHSAGCQERCKCGRVFYDTANSWDWDDGEYEALVSDATATGVAYSVERVHVNGDLYAKDCDCWHPIALKVISFLDANDSSIAEFFKLEKARKEELAKQSVTIDILYDEIKDGWREMGSAPRNATTVEVLMHNRTTKHAHWAQDLSGEEQPPFRGWFEKGEHFNSQIDDPIAWRYLDRELPIAQKA